MALTTLALGWMLSRFMSVLVAYRVLKRFRLSKDATSAIRSLVFYCMLIGVVLQAMHMVNIDLTAFTILGGALAIGVGFGSQALINNFIGGLIMLAERPVRLGERIIFGGTDGIVEDVGFRCTKLRTSSDHLLTIPNSTLVNESIENIDRRRTIRRKLTIAVTYNITRDAAGQRCGCDSRYSRRKRDSRADSSDHRLRRILAEGVFQRIRGREPEHPGRLLVRAGRLVGLHGTLAAREFPDHGRIRATGNRLRVPVEDVRT